MLMALAAIALMMNERKSHTPEQAEHGRLMFRVTLCYGEANSTFVRKQPR